MEGVVLRLRKSGLKVSEGYPFEDCITMSKSAMPFCEVAELLGPIFDFDEQVDIECRYVVFALNCYEIFTQPPSVFINPRVVLLKPACSIGTEVNYSLELQLL